MIKEEHKQGREAEILRWPSPDEEPAVRTVILSNDGAAKREAISVPKRPGRAGPPLAAAFK